MGCFNLCFHFPLVCFQFEKFVSQLLFFIILLVECFKVLLGFSKSLCDWLVLFNSHLFGIFLSRQGILVCLFSEIEHLDCLFLEFKILLGCFLHQFFEFLPDFNVEVVDVEVHEFFCEIAQFITLFLDVFVDSQKWRDFIVYNVTQIFAWQVI